MFPRHDLLGLGVLNCSVEAPQWKNVLKVEDVPWLRNHSIQDIIVYPMEIQVLVHRGQVPPSIMSLQSYQESRVNLSRHKLVRPENVIVNRDVNWSPSSLSGGPKLGRPAFKVSDSGPKSSQST